MKLGIDVRTTNKQGLIHQLKRLTGTVSAVDGGLYREDHNYSQVHVETDKTVREMEDWLYTSTRSLETIGAFELQAV